jgi:hypothetical protein
MCCPLIYVTFSFLACTTPGAVAPSTHPLSEDYVALSNLEEVSSCGYTILSVPVKNPQPVSDLIDELVKSRGGEALMDVTSNSSVFFYGVGVANCVSIKAKVVKRDKK